MSRQRRFIRVAVPSADGVFLVFALSLSVSALLYVVGNWVPWSAFDSEMAPAWVQGVGSLVAIAVAIGVPAWQHQAAARAARVAERLEEIRRIEIVYELTCVMLNFSRGTYLDRGDPAKTETHRRRHYQLSFTRHLAVQLGTIRPLDMPSGKIFRIVGRLAGDIGAIEEAIQAGRPEPMSGSYEYARPWFIILGSLTRSCIELEEEICSRGGSHTLAMAETLDAIKREFIEEHGVS